MELILADLEMVNRRVEKATKAAKGDKKFLHEAEVFKALAEHLDAGKSARTFSCGDDDRALVETRDLLSLKPHHLRRQHGRGGFADYENNRYFRLVRDLAQKRGRTGAAHLRQAGAGYRRAGRSGGAGHVPGGSGHRKSGLDRLIQCAAMICWPDLLPDLRQGRVPGVDHPQGYQGPAGGGQDPLRYRAGLHPGGDHQLRR